MMAGREGDESRAACARMRTLAVAVRVAAVAASLFAADAR